MFEATDTAWAPWFIARSDNKRQARLNIIAHLLSSIPYKKVPRGDVKLPKRNVARSKPLSASLKSFRRQTYESGPAHNEKEFALRRVRMRKSEPVPLTSSSFRAA